MFCLYKRDLNQSIHTHLIPADVTAVWTVRTEFICFFSSMKASSHHCSIIIHRLSAVVDEAKHEGSQQRKLDDRKLKKISWKRRSFKVLALLLSACKADGLLAINVESWYRCVHDEVRHKNEGTVINRFDLLISDPLVAHSSGCLGLLFKQKNQSTRCTILLLIAVKCHHVGKRYILLDFRTVDHFQTSITSEFFSGFM